MSIIGADKQQRLFCPAEEDTKHCWSHDSVQGGQALSCVWTALSLVMGKPGLTYATMKEESLSKHLSLYVHPVDRSHDLNAVQN